MLKINYNDMMGSFVYEYIIQRCSENAAEK